MLRLRLPLGVKVRPAIFMMSALLFVTVVTFVAAALAEAADSTPTLVKSTYKVYKGGVLIGTIEEQFSRDGNNYKLVSDTETAGPLRLFLRDQLKVTSVGTIDSGGLKPNSYHFSRRDNQKKNISAIFDWSKRQIVSHHDDEDEIFDLPASTQDRVSAMYQFMFNVPRAAEVSLWMSQGKKAELYRYRKMGAPTLLINKESIPTVYYSREAKEGESRVHLWLGTGKDKYYLPVKIIFEDEHGATLEQILVSLHTESGGKS